MPLFAVSLAFLAGIVLGKFTGLPTTICLIAAAGLVVLRLGWRRLIPQPLLGRLLGYRLPAPLWLLLVILAFGAIRYQTSLPQMGPDFIAWYNDGGATYFVEGVVIKPPDARDPPARGKRAGIQGSLWSAGGERLGAG
jgi:hypothetical protein